MLVFWITLLISVPTITVLSIVIQLCSRRKDKYQKIVHSVFYRTQRPGAGAWGLGPGITARGMWERN